MTRIQETLNLRPFAIPEGRITVALSYGIASQQKLEEENPAALLKLADERLYAFKRRRKRSLPEIAPPGRPESSDSLQVKDRTSNGSSRSSSRIGSFPSGIFVFIWETFPTGRKKP